MTTNVTTANADALVLQCNDNSNFKPHPPGIWQAMCLDVIDLGLVWTEFQGKRKLVRKLKLVFETEAVGEDGKRGIVTKNFTASLHPKARLAEFIGKWRGRPVVPGENVDLKKLPGTSCTLVLSHQQSMSGRTYVSIDAVSKAARKVTPSGTYDPVAMRQRIAEWAAKDAAQAGQSGPQDHRTTGQQAAQPAATTASWNNSKSPAATAAAVAPQGPSGQAPKEDFDPEVGF